MNRFDVVVIGGGQSGLAVGYYLRRSGLSYVILDNAKEAGGAWPRMWKSLRLFSPAQWSSLPGMLMLGGGDYYPTRDEVIAYLKNYETKYALPVHRPIDVRHVKKTSNGFELETDAGAYYATAVVSATGSFNNPHIPVFKGIDSFKGELLHSSQYMQPEHFAGRRVAVVGEGNSGAQILAELSKVADTIWVTQKEPRFLPDHVDGRVLFDAATQMYEAQKAGKDYKPPSLGDIVMVPPVKEARERNVLQSLPPFDHFTSDSIVWADGTEKKIDAIIFCTGFRPSLNHLSKLLPIAETHPNTNGTKSTAVDGLWLVGYGHWTGFASATLIGVGRSAKATADQIAMFVKEKRTSTT